ncbi:hypothetical protein Q1695_011341 [Nippostrongylus brasiliensis]|nr:hypothetical protein Q1695_011341 [Nippostrongylus brasiliensis]
MPPEFVNEKLPAEVLSKLASFRDSGTFCDVVLEADSSSNAKSESTSPTFVRAHKNVLAAASPYFREALSSDSYVECKEIRVVVKDIDGKTMGLLVDYMYTGRLDIDEKNVRALFGAAKILQLDCIRNECLRYLKGHLSVSNWMETATFAKAQNCTELDDAAALFAGQHFGELVESEALLAMDESSFLHFISDDRLNSKDAVFEAVINWVKHDSSRRASLPNVLVGVRLPLISREFLLDRVYTEPMIQGSPACIAMLGAVFHNTLSKNKTSEIPGSWYRRRQTPHYKMILIAGGRSNDCSFLADVNIYDPYSQQWTSAAPLLRARCGLGMATVGDSIYAVGGEDASYTLQSVEIYDVQRNSWRAGPKMQRCRQALGVTALDGIIFAVGGRDGGYTFREAEMLDPRQGKWISLPSMLNGRHNFVLAAVNGLLYAAGGDSDRQNINSVEVYDPRACRWTAAQPMLKKRYAAAATIFRDQIVVVGGADEKYSDFSSAEMLTDNGWTFLPGMSVPRRNLGVVDVDGSLFAFGGHNGYDYHSSIEYFDSTRWEMLQACQDATEECLLRNHTPAMSPIVWKHLT